jgi:hypothetical protein
MPSELVSLWSLTTIRVFVGWAYQTESLVAQNKGLFGGPYPVGELSPITFFSFSSARLLSTTNDSQNQTTTVGIKGFGCEDFMKILLGVLRKILDLRPGSYFNYLKYNYILEKKYRKVPQTNTHLRQSSTIFRRY